MGLSINLGAYLSEVFRAAILAVDGGQMHAGLALGMRRWIIYRKVILPQAALIAVPTVGGYFISLLKDCALVSFISVEGCCVMEITSSRRPSGPWKPTCWSAPYIT